MDDAIPEAGDGHAVAADRRELLQEEYAELRERARLGGLFYVAGWGVLAGFTPLLGHAPGPALALGALIVVLVVLRWMQPPAARQSDPQRGIDQLWWLLSLTAVAWSVLATWVSLVPALDEARTLAVFCTLAYATAMANGYAMRPGWAAALVAVLFVPETVVQLLDARTRALGIAMAVYLIYLALSLRQAADAHLRRRALNRALREQRDRFEQLSRVDALTGLSNRRDFMARLEAAIAADADRALLIFDLDHFKHVNDSHGHAVGDACLRAFAGRLRAVFPSDATLGRLGGEEFAVLLTGPSVAKAVALAEAFRTSLDAACLPGVPAGCAVTVSVGVGLRRTGECGDRDAWYREVDEALYAAKHGGRNRVVRAGVSAGG